MRSMKKMTCRALVVSLLALSFQTANAGMIGADLAAAPGAAQADRGELLPWDPEQFKTQLRQRLQRRSKAG